MARRGRGEGSITFREKLGLWQGRIELERDPKTGKWRRRTLYAKTKAKLLEKLTAAKLAPDAVRTSEIASVGALFDLFIAATTAEKRESTVLIYTRSLKLLRPALEKLPLGKLTKAKIVTALAGLVKGNDAKEAHRVLRTCLRWAVASDYLASSPAQGIKAPRSGSSKKLKFWAPGESKKFLETARGHELELLWRLLLSTGVRIGEALGLQWGDVDQEQGTLRIDRQLLEVRGRRKLGPPKTESARRKIRLSPVDLKMLEKARPKDADPEQMIFVGPRSRFLRRRVVDDAFRKLIEKSGVPKLNVHGTRHSNATSMIRAGVNIQTVSERLGHASVMITWKVYSHVLPEAHAEAAQVVDSILGAAVE